MRIVSKVPVPALVQWDPLAGYHSQCRVLDNLYRLVYVYEPGHLFTTIQKRWLLRVQHQQQQVSLLFKDAGILVNNWWQFLH